MRRPDVQRVLVVEDEVLVGMLIEEMLQALYYQDDPHRRYEKDPAPMLDEVAANPGGY